MKKLMITGALFLLSSTAALSEPMTYEEICSRIELTAEVFSYDKSGNLIEKKEEYEKSTYNKPWSAIKSSKNCTLSSSWSSVWNKNEAPLAIWYELEVHKNKKISLSVKQYKNLEKIYRGEPKIKAIKEEKFDLTSMQTVLWESPLHKNPKMLIRFSPDLLFKSLPQDLDKLELSGKSILISDHEGYIWAKNISFRSQYAAFKTHRGAFALSYYKFPGSTLIGEASSNLIKISNKDGTIINLSAESSFLPEGVSGNIYGIFYDKKTVCLDCVSSHTSNKEAEFIKTLEESY